MVFFNGSSVNMREFLKATYSVFLDIKDTNSASLCKKVAESFFHVHSFLL
jgi:hypothetical protein